MFGSSAYYIFFLITLLFFTSTNVVGSCSYSETSCYNTFDSWCCSYDEKCGSSYGSCNDSSDLPPAIIAVIIIASIFCFVLCLSCCIQSQRRQQQQRLCTAYVNSNMHHVPSPYQQQVIRGPVQVVHVRPVYSVGNAPRPQAFPSIYEAPPPSYEAVTANVPFVHQSSPPPPVTAAVEQSH